MPGSFRGRGRGFRGIYRGGKNADRARGRSWYSRESANRYDRNSRNFNSTNTISTEHQGYNYRRSEKYQNSRAGTTERGIQSGYYKRK